MSDEEIQTVNEAAPEPKFYTPSTWQQPLIVLREDDPLIMGLFDSAARIRRHADELEASTKRTVENLRRAADRICPMEVKHQ